MKDIQIIFSNDAKIFDSEEIDIYIDKGVFDFYDVGNLEELSVRIYILLVILVYLSFCYLRVLCYLTVKIFVLKCEYCFND